MNLSCGFLAPDRLIRKRLKVVSLEEMTVLGSESDTHDRRKRNAKELFETSAQ